MAKSFRISPSVPRRLVCRRLSMTPRRYEPALEPLIGATPERRLWPARNRWQTRHVRVVVAEDVMLTREGIVRVLDGRGDGGRRGGRGRRGPSARGRDREAGLRDRRHPHAADEHRRRDRRRAADPRAPPGGRRARALAVRRARLRHAAARGEPRALRLPAQGPRQRSFDPRRRAPPARAGRDGRRPGDRLEAVRAPARGRSGRRALRPRARGARARRGRALERRDRPAALHRRAHGRGARQARLLQARHRPGARRRTGACSRCSRSCARVGSACRRGRACARAPASFRTATAPGARCSPTDRGTPRRCRRDARSAPPGTRRPDS